MKKIIALLALATVMTACDKNIEKINRDVSSASALSTPSTETISAAPTTCPASDNLPPFATDSATFDDSNGPAVDVILDNNQAYTEGPWFHSTVISGYYSNDYIYAKRDSEVKSVMTWNWTAPTKGFYNIYENHTADSNRSPKASFKVVNNHLKRTITKEIDQRVKGHTWVKLATVWVKDNGEITVSTSNQVEAGADGTNKDSGVVIGDAIRIIKVQGTKYQASANESSKVTLTCPSGQQPEFVIGHYFDPSNTSKRCTFDFDDVVGTSFLIANHLCGDPSWGTGKRGTVEYTCR